MFDDFEILPDGSFEEVQTCPNCGSNDIHYIDKPPHIKAECGNCGSYIKFVQKFTNENWARAVKERDGYVCQRCGKILVGRQAKAHHKIPAWFMPQLKFDLNNGICLCGDCHKQIHGYGGTIKEADDETTN